MKHGFLARQDDIFECVYCGLTVKAGKDMPAHRDEVCPKREKSFRTIEREQYQKAKATLKRIG